MPVSITIHGEAFAVLSELETLLKGRANFVQPVANDQPIPINPAPGVVTDAPKKTRNKAPAADVVIDQKPAEPTDGLTVDEAREHMKKFAADGHMDQVSAALESFGVKKVSDVDPDAKGAKSAKFSAFVVKIDELVKAKS